MTSKRWVLLAVVFLFLMGVFLSMGFGYYLLSPARKGGENQIFLVREGSTLRDVAGELKRDQIISSKVLFVFWGRLMGYGTKLKAGEYRLNSGMAPIKILNILARGRVVTHAVTIPEGFTRRQVAEMMEKRGLVAKEEFLRLTADPELAKHYGISRPTLEGFLYPDTYLFARGLAAHSVIDTMVRRFWEVIEPLREEIQRSGMSLEEVVTLASMVEKETGLPEERPRIAKVFLNRLKKGMRLESDPTVIYGMKDFSGNLTKRDLARPSPYNTYVIRGLPAGPIANPGKGAIEAVLHPAETNDLYFVSKNDGSHYFSRTLAEHRRAVNLYQKKKGRVRK